MSTFLAGLSFVIILLSVSHPVIGDTISYDDRWKILGCYAAPAVSEAPLQLRVYWPNNTRLSMSHSACFEECTFQLWEGRYFGLSQNGGCHCGTRLLPGPANAKVADTMCDETCPDNPLETCGGVNVMLVLFTDTVVRLPARVIGCFLHTKIQKVLEDEYELIDSSFMSHARCATFCLRIQQTQVFALTNGSNCICGNKFLENASRISYSSCYGPCANYNFDACGNFRALLVLEVHQIAA